MVNSKLSSTVGWDIGGAHLKLAYLEGETLKTHQWACPLWKGIIELSRLLNMASSMLPESITHHNVTMTGELADCFEDRDDGVKQIIDCFIKEIKSDDVKIFSQNRSLDANEAKKQSDRVASVNWIASAEVIAQKCKDAIFIDMGSTTTDILVINNKQLQLNGLTDYERLKSGELMYTGVVRSCVNTICPDVIYKNEAVPLIAENFAVTADVYRILGLLPEHADLGETMDGQAKDKISSLKRFARMVGEDYIESNYDDWVTSAEYIATQQKNRIINKVQEIIFHHKSIRKIIGAGVGRFVIKEVADQLDLSYQDFADCIVPSEIKYDAIANDCAPAVALVFYQ